jgi:tetratricopeptide (TPR) repeat protein
MPGKNFGEAFNVNDWNGLQAYELDTVASAYFRVGKWGKALLIYQRLQLLQMGGRWEWGAICAGSYYWMGRVLEELGERSEAREKYQKFLSLWKDADPGLPDVEDAKKRLASL